MKPRFACAFVALLALGACKSVDLSTADGARKANEELLAKDGDALEAKHGARFLVVQDGGFVAAASLADDAVRAADQRNAKPAQRFVFRAGDRGARLFRTTFLAAGGVAAGRRLFEDLGWRASGGNGRPLVLTRMGRSRTLDVTNMPRIAVEVAPLDGGPARTLDAVLDLDFDGPLLLTREIADELHLVRSEVPGRAEVQVALGRPFEARRALVAVRVPALDASGTAEALVPGATK